MARITLTIILLILHFNIHFCKGSVINDFLCFHPVHISLLAPAKGATRCNNTDSVETSISIHALAKGATIGISSIIGLGAFQSTLPQRERLADWMVNSVASLFQSTLPQRERRCTNIRKACQPNFNPHSRKGSDKVLINGKGIDIISIHAPAKGATLPLTIPAPDSLFQSTLPQRERQAQKHSLRHSQLFQSTLPQRERLVHFSLRNRRGVFQSTLPQRERLYASCQCSCWIRFQSTLPQRERHNHHNKLQSSLQFQSTLPQRERRGIY